MSRWRGLSTGVREEYGPHDGENERVPALMRSALSLPEEQAN